MRSQHKGMSRKKTKKKHADFLQSIVEVFTGHPTQSYNSKQVASAVGLDKALRDTLLVTLDGLIMQGMLESPEPGRYILKKQEEIFVIGTVDMTKQGSAYIVPDEEEHEDIFVSEHNLNQALHGDKVRIRIFNKKIGRSEGEVIEIIEYSRRTFVGKIEISERYSFVVPDSRHMPYDIFVPLSDSKGAKNKQKVVVQINEWKKGTKCPTGEIIDVLGDAGSNDVEMHAILASFDLPYSYPEHIDKLAKRISGEISAKEYSMRRDFRGTPTFTIDPKDAKDFDDALSIRKLDNGNMEIGIHIADVTHYVKSDTAINREAEERATSVYLVDRTVPMLPERLSNFICSLRPDEEKLCFSAVFEISDKAAIKSEWFGKTVILSNRRFTYEEAQDIIETGQGEYADEILELNKIARILREKRFKAGAVTFEREEPRFELDDEGRPISVYSKQMKESNQLVEEFMLLANKKVAERIGKKVAGKKARTFVYRIHDKPNPDKLKSFSEFIKRFGYNAKLDEEENTSKEINKILKDSRNKPEANLVETLAVRSMAKAIYSTENVGHYGLAFPYYTHFTSPIRRYPDMMVNRLLMHYLEGGKSADASNIEKLCKHSSAMEQRAADAERASIKYKMVEFMQDKIGVTFDGLISGVTEWGIYVELVDTKIEGMISVRAMKDDYYYYDEKNYCMVGRASGVTYTIGNKVSVRVINADLNNKHLDFELINPELEEYRAAKKSIIQAPQRAKPRPGKGSKRKGKK